MGLQPLCHDVLFCLINPILVSLCLYTVSHDVCHTLHSDTECNKVVVFACFPESVWHNPRHIFPAFVFPHQKKDGTNFVPQNGLWYEYFSLRKNLVLELTPNQPTPHLCLGKDNKRTPCHMSNNVPSVHELQNNNYIPSGPTNIHIWLLLLIEMMIAFVNWNKNLVPCLRAM